MREDANGREEGHADEGEEEDDVLAEDGSLHEGAVRPLVGEQGEGGKEGEDCGEEKAVPASDILLSFVEEEAGDDCVQDDDANRPDCVVAQESAGEGKGRGPEEHVGEEVEGGCLEGVDEGRRWTFQWTAGHPPVDTSLGDREQAECNATIIQCDTTIIQEQVSRVFARALHNLSEDPCKEKPQGNRKDSIFSCLNNLSVAHSIAHG